jgi:hypothetical protein
VSLPFFVRRALALASLATLAACGAGTDAGDPPPPAAPAPRVAGFSVSGSPPAGGGVLVVRGSGFQAASSVTFDGLPVALTGFQPGAAPEPDQLRIVIPPSPLPPGVTDGFVDVVVRNPDGQSSTLAQRSADGTPWPGNFHYGPPPVVTDFGPVGPKTGAGLDQRLLGTGFSADAGGARTGLKVLLSGPSSSVLAIRVCPDAVDPACPDGVASPTPTSVLAKVPAGQLLPGDYAFVVVDFDGQTGTSAATFAVP